jgi:hypothetical protein
MVNRPIMGNPYLPNTKTVTPANAIITTKVFRGVSRSARKITHRIDEFIVIV